MIEDYLWRPATEVKPGQRVFLVYPGSPKLQPQLLSVGWQWHWPLVTTMRAISDQPWRLAFGSEMAADYVIEPIVCITKDHHLFVVEGGLASRLAEDESGQRLASLSRKNFSRQAQNWVRQALRAVIAEYQSKSLDSPSLTQLQQRLCKELNLMVGEWGLMVEDCQVKQIEPYRLRPDGLEKRNA